MYTLLAMSCYCGRISGYPLTKEILRNYKYTNMVTKYAIQIRETICDEIEKGNVNCEEHTKYAYKIDEQSPLYKSATLLNPKMFVLMDVSQQLQSMFPDSKISVVEKEIQNGFAVSSTSYIEVDWS